jgi:hypothetical protein
MHVCDGEIGFSERAFPLPGRDGENPSSWSSPKRSSGGIEKDLHYIGPTSQNIAEAVGQEQAKKSASWSAKWPMPIRLGEVRESTGNC